MRRSATSVSIEQWAPAHPSPNRLQVRAHGPPVGAYS